MVDTVISEDFLKDLSVPFEGPKETVLHALKEYIASHSTEVSKDVEYQLRILKFLHGFKLNASKKRKRKADQVAQDEGSGVTVEESDALARSFYSQLVLEFLKCRLAQKTYTKFLLHVHDRIIPNMPKPLLLTDFLTASFAKGGLISILSLSGLFVLVKDHNLNFPKFYEHFYSLLTPEVLQAKYRARFFYLADQFMSSSHIPAYTCAAVAKRLSRLSLTAPADALPVIVAFIFNLIIRHASLEVLIHRTSDVEDVEKDPFLFEEMDMMKCRALDSSLWEIRTLKSHYSDVVAKLAEKMDQKLPEVELDITDYLETDVAELVAECLVEPFPENPSSKKLWSNLFPMKNSGYASLWSL